MNAQVYDLKGAADRLGYTHQYVRMLVKEGRLDAEKVPIAPGAEVWKYLITEESIVAFEGTVFSRSGREDNRTKWVAYATFAEMKEALDLLEEAGLGKIADTIRPWNKLKAMPEWLEEKLDGEVET